MMWLEWGSKERVIRLMHYTVHCITKWYSGEDLVNVQHIL